MLTQSILFYHIFQHFLFSVVRQDNECEIATGIANLDCMFISKLPFLCQNPAFMSTRMSGKTGNPHVKDKHCAVISAILHCQMIAQRDGQKEQVFLDLVCFALMQHKVSYWNPQEFEMTVFSQNVIRAFICTNCRR